MPELIVALDVPDLTDAARLIDTLAPLDVGFKVGYEAMYAYGDALLALLHARGLRVMLDLKLHDIPRTVAAAVHALVRPGVRILTVHALGGAEMLSAAVEAAAGRARELDIDPPHVFAITILTSIAREELAELGLSGGPAENAIRLAALARDARCSGVVCSVAEVADLKAFFGHEFLTITPGIRPAGGDPGDQSRIATPAAARATGTDFIVVGRPIVQAPDPLAASRAILAELRPV